MSHSLLAASSGLPLAVSQTASPVGIWKTLLTRLLAQHYGLTLNDTQFSNDSVIQAHIDAGIALIDALNFMVEKYDLVRTDRQEFSVQTPSPFISHIDMLRARRATGLMARRNYKTVTDITRGTLSGPKQ